MREEKEEKEKMCVLGMRHKEMNKTLIATCYSRLVLVPVYCSNKLIFFFFGSIDVGLFLVF